MEALTTTDALALSTDQAAALSTADVAALTTAQVAVITTADIAALTTADAQALTVTAVSPIKGKAKVRHQRQVKTVNAVTAEESTSTEVTDDDADEMPASVKLAAPYAFYEDDGKLRSWAPGRIVEDAEEIALLVTRGAVFEVQ